MCVMLTGEIASIVMDNGADDVKNFCDRKVDLGDRKLQQWWKEAGVQSVDSHNPIDDCIKYLNGFNLPKLAQVIHGALSHISHRDKSKSKKIFTGGFSSAFQFLDSVDGLYENYESKRASATDTAMWIGLTNARYDPLEHEKHAYEFICRTLGISKNEQEAPIDNPIGNPILAMLNICAGVQRSTDPGSEMKRGTIAYKLKNSIPGSHVVIHGNDAIKGCKFLDYAADANSLGFPDMTQCYWRESCDGIIAINQDWIDTVKEWRRLQNQRGKTGEDDSCEQRLLNAKTAFRRVGEELVWHRNLSGKVNEEKSATPGSEIYEATDMILAWPIGYVRRDTNMFYVMKHTSSGWIICNGGTHPEESPLDVMEQIDRQGIGAPVAILLKRVRE